MGFFGVDLPNPSGFNAQFVAGARSGSIPSWFASPIFEGAWGSAKIASTRSHNVEAPRISPRRSRNRRGLGDFRLDDLATVGASAIFPSPISQRRRVRQFSCLG